MNLMCPVSFKKANENAARINAVLAAVVLLIFLFTPLKWIILIAGADFFIRGFLDPKYSLFGRISKNILRVFDVKPIMIDAGPKIFAAKVGFFFCCILTVSWLLNIESLGLAAGLIFTACTVLEAAFRFCAACWMYPFICGIKGIKAGD